MVNISNSHPIPPANKHWRFKYPWPTLKKGQSFFAPKGDGQALGAHRDSIRAQCSNMGKKFGCKFVSKEATEDGVEGFRVWRTS